MTSHFAGNKVTLYDFQLAEAMNQSYKIALKSYSAYPWIKPKTAASWKIFYFTFLGILVTFNLIRKYGEQYESAFVTGSFDDFQITELTIKPFILDVE